MIRSSREIVARIPRNLASKCSGLSARQIARFVNEMTIPRKRAMTLLVMLAEAWEKAGGDEARLVWLTLRN